MLEVKSDAVKNNIARYLDVRSMNQGKLEVVKLEMARVNIDILAISELRQTGMSKLNSADHYILPQIHCFLPKYKALLLKAL